MEDSDEESESDDEDNVISEEGTYIECNAPSGWPKGTKTNVKIAFDGHTFLQFLLKVKTVLISKELRHIGLLIRRQQTEDKDYAANNQYGICKP